MKIMVLSFPKAGTYLVAEFLQQLGLEFTWLHMQTTHYTDYKDADPVTARYSPEKLKVIMPLSESIMQVGDNQFAVGHISPSEYVQKLLKGFRIVFLFREVRTALFSYFKFLRETGRQQAVQYDWFQMQDIPAAFLSYLHEQGARRINMYNSISAWIHIPSVVLLRFEWLKERRVSSLKSFLQYLGISTKGVAQALERSLAAQTITRSNMSTYSFKTCWTKEAEAFFQSYGGEAINEKLGYGVRR